jgi:hypothetical protein
MTHLFPLRFNIVTLLSLNVSGPSYQEFLSHHNYVYLAPNLTTQANQVFSVWYFIS